jgi:hypothetical protein
MQFPIIIHIVIVITMSDDLVTASIPVHMSHFLWQHNMPSVFTRLSHLYVTLSLSAHITAVATDDNQLRNRMDKVTKYLFI